MTSSDPPNSPITDADLALYAEGLLGPDRSAQVEQFLLKHPELEIYSALWSQTDVDTSAGTDSDGIPGTQTRSTVLCENPDRLRPSATAWKFVTACLVVAIGGISLWGLADARAIESTLNQTEQILLTENPALSPQVRNSRIALEQLGGSIWLSRENSLRRDRLLASIYVTQARLELGHHNQKDFLKTPAAFPPLELCSQAISLVQPHAALDADCEQVLRDAYQLRGQICYLFGTFMRTPETLSLGVDQMSLAVDSLLKALEISPAASNGSAQRIQLSGLLFKTLHKRGAGRPVDERIRLYHGPSKGHSDSANSAGVFGRV
ncbi:MAG: hypothetical protein R3C20_21090 [Planctomycetaceae bacterium]